MKVDVKYQDYLARDLIDMALEYSTDKNIAEYLSSICFNLDMVFENADTPIPWSKIFNILDQQAFTKIDNDFDQESQRALKQIRDACQSRINQRSKKQ